MEDNRRKNFLIKKSFQFTFLGAFIALIAVESVLIIGLFIYLSRDTLTTGYINSSLRVEQTQNFFMIPFMMLTLIIVLGLALTGMIVFIMLSHRLAGPFYRFEKTLEQVEKGDLTPRVHLRKNDQFTELEDSLNRFLESLNRRISGIQSEVDEVKVLLSKKDDLSMLEKVGKKIDSIVSQIKHFKVASKSPNDE